jgi:tetratricopeptide (TPR) repeat protein
MNRLKYVLILFILIVVSVKAENNAYTQWQKRRELLKQDKSVARYYTFEDVKDSKSVVVDLGKDGKNLSYTTYQDLVTKEVFDDLKVIEGRFPGKKAVRLDKGSYRGETFNIKDDQFSAEIWFRRQGPGSVIPASKFKVGTILAVSGYREGWRLISSYESSNTLSFEIGQPNGSTINYAKIPLADNVWHHFVVTFDGTRMNLYINGQLAEKSMTMRDEEKKTVKTDSFKGKYVPAKAPFVVGFSGYGVGSSKLDIDEIVVYNRVLKQEEISLSYQDIFLKADTYIKQGNYKKAREEYNKMKGQAGFGTEFALFNIAESYRLEKDYVNSHKTFEEIQKVSNLSDYYRIYAFFQQAEVYIEQKNNTKAREVYQKILQVPGALEHHIFNSKLKVADTYKDEKKYSVARQIYEKLLIEEESKKLPHDGYRLDLRDRLETIDGLADGATLKTRHEKLVEWVNSPKKSIYVSIKGNDKNIGTKAKPFASIQRAQEEVKKIKKEGMPAGGINVYLRGGKYLIDESISFGIEDSGTADAPVIYRNYPNEEVRIMGGKQVTNFKPLSDPEIIRRLPDESKNKVWVSDLKELGITDYGQLLNRGSHAKSNLSALELFFDNNPMTLARWPNQGYERVSKLVTPEGDGVLGGQSPRTGTYQYGRFCYSGDRPLKWKEDKNIWVYGYFAYEYEKSHTNITSIDTENRIINIGPDTRYHRSGIERHFIRVKQNAPYVVYNLLSELDAPGEWYLDRETGKLYFYPPSDIKKSEIFVSTLSVPFLVMNDASHIGLYGLTFEVNRSNGLEIKKGQNNLIAGCTIRNTGQWAVNIPSGWNHKVFGCDMYNMGEGGVILDGGDRKKLIPAGHIVENNHIYSFNKFEGGYRHTVRIQGIGQRVSHNVTNDTPMQAIHFIANDHIIEFNELHDIVYEGRELGAMYVYSNNWAMMNRGNIIRNNFFHHISYHSSPNLTQGLNAIHIDALNGGLVIEKNFFYRFPSGVSNPQPENRIENNIFVDAGNRSIGQGNRTGIFYTPDGEPKVWLINSCLVRDLIFARYKQPPWSNRYPQLFDVLYRDKPIAWPQNNFIERNINTGGPFLSISAGIKDDNIIRNNWDGDDPFFIDRNNADFHLRPGSPVYGLTGCEPLTMKNIGVYKSPLRASWPINRTKEDIGRYYKPDWSGAGALLKTDLMRPLKRISSPKYHTVPLKKSSVDVDGNLNTAEWGQLDKSNSLSIEEFYTGEKQVGAKSYAWFQYDNENLYIAVKHEPDPFKLGMLPRLKEHIPQFEVAIESQHGPKSLGWWIDDMVTGPVYSLCFDYNGEFKVNNIFGMPHKNVVEIEKAVEYKRAIQNDENRVWTQEIKIPFKSIGITPKDVEQLAFNLGVYNKAGWFAWVSTGCSIWRVENAGFIKFAK